MRCCIVRWPYFATLLILLTVLVLVVESKKFRIVTERPDYKMLVVKLSQQLDTHVLDFAHLLMQLEQLRGLLIRQSYERLMQEKENYLVG